LRTDRYVVFKQSGTHSDSLTAIGAADLLRHIEPRLVDCGDRFEVRLARNLGILDLRAVEPGFAYLMRPKKHAPAVPPERIVRTGVSCITTAESRMYSILGRMKAFHGPNRLVSRYASLKRDEWEARIWECLHGGGRFVFQSPLVQLFDPHGGRGYALLKPSGTDRRDRTKNRWARPFEQWLRFRGYFQGAAGWFAQGDLRLFTPIPFDISYERLTKVAEQFRDLRLGGVGSKMDCRAVLGFTRLLIESCHRKRRPREMVNGLWVTHYKDMGQTLAVIGMDQLALPNWMDLHTAEHAERWLSMLEEHDTVLRRLTDSHSDELGLLKQYRATFQMDRQDAIAAFLEFLAAYGPLVFRRRSQGHWSLPQLSLRSVREILDASPECGTILENPGIAAVTSAIRSATFGAQGNRHRGDATHREIRYGLFAEMRRASLVGKREICTIVSEFIASFNAEGVRRRRSGLAASGITHAEIDAFGRALDGAPDSMLMGMLLCGVSSGHRGESSSVERESEMVKAALPG
jgi:hypothetical protein